MKTHFRRAAFARIELLAVMVMLCLLTLLVLPVLTRSQSDSGLAGCLNNQRQLAQAWWMYAGENADRIVSHGDSSNGWRIRPGNGEPLIPFQIWRHVRSNRDAVIVADQWGYQAGALYPYATDPRILHCPSDESLNSPIPKYTGYGAMDGMSNGGETGYRLAKTSELRHPADRFLWVEENDPRTITYNRLGVSFVMGENLGTWGIVGSGNGIPAPPHYDQLKSWYDVPATRHGSGTAFSFADGSARLHRWRDVDTLRISANPPAGRGGQLGPISSPNDLLFVAKGYGSRLNP